MSEETRPGDAVGRDEQGHVRISRTIPLQWLVGGLIVVAGQAIAMYYGQQRLSEAVREIQIEIKAINLSIANTGTKSIELQLRMSDVERRLANFETDRKR